MLALARDHGDRLRGVVLLAPALTWDEPPAGPPALLIAPPGTVVIHGLHDDVIPIQASRDLVARSPGTTLVERDDGHRLEASLDVLVDVLRSLG